MSGPRFEKDGGVHHTWGSPAGLKAIMILSCVFVLHLQCGRDPTRCAPAEGVGANAHVVRAGTRVAREARPAAEGASQLAQTGSGPECASVPDRGRVHGCPQANEQLRQELEVRYTPSRPIT